MPRDATDQVRQQRQRSAALVAYYAKREQPRRRSFWQRLWANSRTMTPEEQRHAEYKRIVDQMRARNAALRKQSKSDQRHDNDRRKRSWWYNLWATIRDGMAG